MTVHVVFDVPARGAGRSSSASAASVVGVLLMGLGIAGVCGVVSVVAVVAVVVALGYVADFLSRLDVNLAWSGSATVVDPQTLVGPGLRVAAGLAASAVVLWLGLVLLRRRRHAVLFLRRFGYDDATRVVTAALAVLGRSWRVVTLDDSDVQAVGARRSGVRTFSRAASERVGKVVGRLSVVTFVAVVGTLAWAANTVADPAELLPGGLLDGSPLRIESPAQVATTIVLVFVATTLVFGVLRRLLFPAFLLARRVERSAQTADGAGRQSVQDADDVEAVGTLVERMSRRVFSPQLMVVTSTNAMWRRAVSRLLASTEVTLVDVSRPTESLLWEIRELSENDDGRCVYIGHVDRLARFLPDVARTAPAGWHVPQYDVLAAAPTSVIGKIERVLEGHEVLAYSSDPTTVGQFSRSLERHLWTTVAAPAPAAPQGRPRATTS